MFTTVYVASVLTFCDNDPEGVPNLMEPYVGNTHAEMIKSLCHFCIQYWDELENDGEIPEIPDAPEEIVSMYFNLHPSDRYEEHSFNILLTDAKEEAIANAAAVLCAEHPGSHKARVEIAELLVGAFAEND